MRIGLLTNNASNTKRVKVYNKHILVQPLRNPNIIHKDYEPLYATIHFQNSNQDNIMRNPLVFTILTQYNISKGLKVFEDSEVTVVLKELK